jgi:hypothetical protein
MEADKYHRRSRATRSCKTSTERTKCNSIVMVWAPAKNKDLEIFFSKRSRSENVVPNEQDSIDRPRFLTSTFVLV